MTEDALTALVDALCDLAELQAPAELPELYYEGVEWGARQTMRLLAEGMASQLHDALVKYAEKGPTPPPNPEMSE